MYIDSLTKNCSVVSHCQVAIAVVVKLVDVLH